MKSTSLNPLKVFEVIAGILRLYDKSKERRKTLNKSRDFYIFKNL